MLVLSGHTDLVRGLAYSPDGATLASVGRDRSVRLWDLASGTERAAWAGHTDGAHAVAFRPDGQTLATGGDRTVRLWDIPSGEARAVLRGHAATVLGLAFAPDGRTLASAAAFREGRKATGLLPTHVILWDPDSLARKSRVTTGEGLGFWCLSYSPDGTQIAVGTEQGVVIRFPPSALPAESTVELRHYPRDPDRPTNWSNWVPGNHWRPPLTDQTPPLKQGAAIRCLTYSPDARCLASTGGRWVILWDTRTGRLIVTLKGHKDQIQSVAFTPDGATLVSAAVDGTIRFWDVASGNEKACFDTGVGRKVESLAVSPDGMTLAAGGERDIAVWDLDDRHRA